ncbi:putative licABCH operon regulator [Collinsella aerofaciens]|uniref:Putative licABCH operon regulator n=1 Tax=Collinsella aerofaciens TaxID=74426 RepID=A0A5K1J0D5_9ACTN|nr:BglG family transcription antiterminator [Collinsella aerofaciens]VWL95567.1 putative licABCH operon regulator [Collinsella aerofaciens]
MIDSQVRKVLFYIEEHEGVMPQLLAGVFDVSDRTIRTYVKKLNGQLEPAAHIHKARGGGYSLVVTDRDAFDRLVQASSEGGIRALPSTPGGRVSYLLSDLLCRTGWITLDDLSEILFVSRNAISGDLKRVEEQLGRFDLSLERRPHYGIRVRGSEMSRRLCLANITLDNLMDSRADDDNRASLNVIAHCVDEVIAEEGFQINSAAYQNLMVHIAIAVRRIREGCYVPMDAEHLEHLRSSREFAVAGRIASGIEEAFSINLPQEEVAYIAIHLAGKQSLYAGPDDEDKGLVISDEVWNVVSEMLELIWDSYHFDLRGDLELRMNLARHIVPLAVRLKYRMHIDNPLLADIKERFTLAYSMALDSSMILAQKYGNRLSDDEAGYIALAFALALERQKGEAPRKNILVVCASGQGSAKLLEYRYRQEFGSLVDRVVTCDASHVDSVDMTGIDYVFTTVPLHCSLLVPVRQVSFFLDDEDMKDLRDLLSDAGLSGSLAPFFAPELFVTDLDVSDKREAIERLCECVAECRKVPSDFCELVLRREELAQTSFGNQVAMPHPVQAVSDDTFVCVGLLSHAIEWNGQAVRAVFLVSVSKAKNKKLESFYRSMAKLLTNKEAIQKLVGNQTWGTLVELLNTFGM